MNAPLDPPPVDLIIDHGQHALRHLSVAIRELRTRAQHRRAEALTRAYSDALVVLGEYRGEVER
jgi:hypothetical protein